MGNYFLYKKCSIDKGVSGLVFLGCDIQTKIKIAIKMFDESDIKAFLNEKPILANIRGEGNFPEFYDSFESDDFQFFINESLIGPKLNSLKIISEWKFNIYSTINIGIDLITNLEILHSQGYVHSDRKPNNISFGSISRNNKNSKKNMGIVNFSNSKCIKFKEKGIYKFSKRKVKNMEIDFIVQIIY